MIQENTGRYNEMEVRWSLDLFLWRFVQIRERIDNVPLSVIEWNTRGSHAQDYETEIRRVR